MKILFVIKDIEYIDPMGLMLLSALAKEKGHSTYVNILSQKNLLDAIKKIKPDTVAYSAKTGEHKYYLAANELNALRANFLDRINRIYKFFL